jgi:quercetin dioxygenase-like cupin family protein
MDKTIRKGKTLNPAKTLSYQKGAIVSATLLDGKSGSVTAFAFDKGQKLSEHTVPFDALVEVLDGKAEITISGKPNILSRGDLIIMPANNPHAVNAISRFKMLLIMLKKG